MRYWIVGYLLLGAMLLASPAAAALLPDQVTVTGSPDWVVAGGSGSGGALITATVLNNSQPVPGIPVTFEIQTGPGSITPATGVTDAQGRASATFTPGTVSGTAVITAQVGGGFEVPPETCTVSIDHAVPDRIAMTAYTPEVAVGEMTTVTIRMVDCYGNPVDNRRVAETVLFTVGSAGETAGFLDGGEYVDSIRQSVDAEGNATVTLRVDQVSGENYVMIYPPESIQSTSLTILGVSHGNPASIAAYVEVNPPILPADGTSEFFMAFVVHDQYGNAVSDCPLSITNSRDTTTTTTVTNSYGQVIVSYGPTLKIGPVTITATAGMGTDTIVSGSANIEFVSSDPVDMMLSANPGVMASRDVNDSIAATVRAKVVDVRGNPVKGEIIGFAIAASDNGGYNATAGPELSSTSGVTDENGYAFVTFLPGAFTTDPTAAGYSWTASGTCDVVATWDSLTRNVTLTWKNYPYLSVETSVSPETVEVNDTIDVTIRLRGDGWVVQQMLPIDVVFCIDRGEDMLRDDPEMERDRMLCAREAAWNFTESLSLGDNRAALVTFGDVSTATSGYPTTPFSDNVVELLNLSSEYNWVKDLGSSDKHDDKITIDAYYPGNNNIQYLDFAEVKKPLGSGAWSDIRTELWDVVPAKRMDQGTVATPLRKGLHTAITHLVKEERPDAVKAVVVLMQNRYCFFGDPFAQGKEMAIEPDTISSAGSTSYYAFNDGNSENMAKYASDNGIIIYPIYYGWGNSQNEEDVPRGLADQTGGQYFMADSASELEEALNDVLLLLKEEASVNTTMNLTFENVRVNSNSLPGNEVLEYVYTPPDSTRITNSYKGDTTMSTRDDTESWNTDRQLHFDAGTIKVGQVWETTFRLKVLMDGNIDLFGSGSTIGFDNGTESLNLPAIYVTVLPDGDAPPMGSAALSVSNLQFTGTEPVYDILPLAWDLTYNGTATVTEDIYRQQTGCVKWVYLGSTPGGTTYQVDVRDMPAGNYSFKVYATAPDAPDSWVTNGPVRVKDLSRAYIQIQ